MVWGKIREWNMRYARALIKSEKGPIKGADETGDVLDPCVSRVYEEHPCKARNGDLQTMLGRKLKRVA
jgi:hypothetical protein